MGEHHFGVGNGRLRADVAERIDKIARSFGATFYSADMPEGPRHWFSCPNRGAPFDRDTERAVWHALKAARLAHEQRLLEQCFVSAGDAS